MPKYLFNGQVHEPTNPDQEENLVARGAKLLAEGEAESLAIQEEARTENELGGAFALGAAGVQSALPFGIGASALGALGLGEEAQASIDANPGAALAGNIAGALAGPIGAGARALGAASGLGRTARLGLEGATEGAALTASDNINAIVLDPDKEASAEGVLSGVLAGALIGGGLSAGVGRIFRGKLKDGKTDSRGTALRAADDARELREVVDSLDISSSRMDEAGKLFDNNLDDIHKGLRNTAVSGSRRDVAKVLGEGDSAISKKRVSNLIRKGSKEEMEGALKALSKYENTIAAGSVASDFADKSYKQLSRGLGLRGDLGDLGSAMSALGLSDDLVRTMPKGGPTEGLFLAWARRRPEMVPRLGKNAKGSAEELADHVVGKGPKKNPLGLDVLAVSAFSPAAGLAGAAVRLVQNHKQRIRSIANAITGSKTAAKVLPRAASLNAISAMNMIRQADFGEELGALDKEPNPKELKETMRKVHAFGTMAPEQREQFLLERYGDMAREFGSDFASSMSKATGRFWSYMASHIPASALAHSDNPVLDDQVLLSPSDTDSWRSRLEYGMDPLGSFERSSGYPPMELLDTVKTVYPRTYHMLRERIFDQLQEQNVSLDYERALALGRALDLPLNRSLAHARTIAAVYRAQSDNSQPQSRQTGRGFTRPGDPMSPGRTPSRSDMSRLEGTRSQSLSR